MKRYAFPAALAALALSLVELICLCARTSLALGFGEWLSLALAILGLLGLPTLIVSVLVLMMYDGALLGMGFGRADSEAPHSKSLTTARGIYGLLMGVALVLAVQRTVMFVAPKFHRPYYQGLAAGFVALVVVALALVLQRPLAGLIAKLLSRFEGKLPKVLDISDALGRLTAFIVLAIVGLFVLPAVKAEFHTLNLNPARLAVCFIVALVLARLYAHKFPQKLQLITTIALVIFIPLAFLTSLLTFSGSAKRLALSRDTLITGLLLNPLQKPFDRDHDGIATILGGEDCNDRDPQIRPGIYDIPNDGIDQNCTGEDYNPQKNPARFSVARLPFEKTINTPKNFILLTVDAIRYDKSLVHMPKLRAFAQRNLEHTNAYSHGATTYWSLPALQTSKMPSQLEMGGDQTPVAGELLLNEIFQRNNFSTALFANVTVFFIRNLRQGSETADYETSHYTIHGAKPGAEHLTNGVLSYIQKFKDHKIKNQKDGFALWAHYYDPHDPYFEVPNHQAKNSSDEARYEAILSYVDDHLARLFDELEKMGLMDETVIVITGDHGDEFEDHGHRFHGRTLYEETTHVPLIWHIPGAEPRSLSTPIGHMEVAPTLTELFGFEHENVHQGRSRLKELLTGEAPSEHPVFFEVLPDSNYNHHQVGMRWQNYKVIYRIDENVKELYDLATDPGEQRNLYGVDDRTAELAPILMRYVDQHISDVSKNKTRANIPREMLRK